MFSKDVILSTGHASNRTIIGREDEHSNVTYVQSKDIQTTVTYQDYEI
jgi:hypothetical protein